MWPIDAHHRQLPPVTAHTWTISVDGAACPIDASSPPPGVGVIPSGHRPLGRGLKGDTTQKIADHQGSADHGRKAVFETTHHERKRARDLTWNQRVASSEWVTENWLASATNLALHCQGR
jgi:hypothetical protein